MATGFATPPISTTPQVKAMPTAVRPLPGVGGTRPNVGGTSGPTAGGVPVMGGPAGAGPLGHIGGSAIGAAAGANPLTPQQRIAALNPQQQQAFAAWVHSQNAPAAGTPGTSPSGANPLELPSGQQVGFQMQQNQLGHNLKTQLAQNQYKINNFNNALRPSLLYQNYLNNQGLDNSQAQQSARGLNFAHGIGAEAFERTLGAQAHSAGDFLRNAMTTVGNMGLNQDQLDHIYRYNLQNLQNHKGLALNAFANRSVK